METARGGLHRCRVALDEYNADAGKSEDISQREAGGRRAYDRNVKSNIQRHGRSGLDSRSLRLHNLFWSDGKVSDTPSGSVVDRIGDCSRDARYRDFSDAASA